MAWPKKTTEMLFFTFYTCNIVILKSKTKISSAKLQKKKKKKVKDKTKHFTTSYEK